MLVPAGGNTSYQVILTLSQICIRGCCLTILEYISQISFKIFNNALNNFHSFLDWTELCMYSWLSHNDISSHSRNEMKGHSQIVADMNFQMHKTTEASFPSSRTTISGLDSICVKGPQERSLLSMTIMPCLLPIQ